MDLARALRLDISPAPLVSFTGAGGKTTALFQLARQLSNERAAGVVVTATAHLGAWQTSLADRHIQATTIEELASQVESLQPGITLVTGQLQDDRTTPIAPALLEWLRANARNWNIPLLVEADGSRGHALKAPAPHEPPVPEFSDSVVVVAGLSALGELLNDRCVYRPEIFSNLSGLGIEKTITPDAIVRVLSHASGGLKNIPAAARRIALLNQADSAELLSIGGEIARRLLGHFNSVVIGSLRSGVIQTIESSAVVILAAGESKRFGSPKQLLDWQGKPFVRHIAETALRADIGQVVVVTGSNAADVENALIGLPVHIVRNANHPEGQSTSIVCALNSLPESLGSCVFLLADQPQIPAEVIRALAAIHAAQLPQILAPLVPQGRRANPVLFDRVTFGDLMQLRGDVGGRALFSKYKVEYLPWHDDRLLLDVDNPEDYQKLLEDLAP